jgi:hypothetical protein
MFKLSANITIKSDTKTWTFKKVSAVEIERSIEKVTGTCTITLPKNTKWANETAIPVRRGNRVKVELGYDDKLETAFEGYIRKTGGKTPVVIECEDEMYVLKNTPCKKKSYPDADLKAMLQEQLPSNIKVDVFGEQKLGKYVVNSDNVAGLLGSLSEQKIICFFKDGVLQAGLLHKAKEIGTLKQKFVEGINIIDASSLNYETADSIRLRIKASGTDRKGKKITVTVGDKDGELRSYFKYNTTKEQLKAEATERLETWKVSGLSGDFTTFGAKLTGLLDRIKLQTNEAPLAVYTVTANRISYSTGGYRQDITIAGKVNE